MKEETISLWDAMVGWLAMGRVVLAMAKRERCSFVSLRSLKSLVCGQGRVRVATGPLPGAPGRSQAGRNQRGAEVGWMGLGGFNGGVGFHGLGLMWGKQPKRTYSTGDSLVVTDPTTSPAISGLSMGERTGSRAFL
jgi:hypothetical protein